MRCKDCGQEVKDIGELRRHKKECHEIEPVASDTIIPIGMCPEETKLYAMGQTVGLRVTGILTPDGIKVEGVNLIR